MRRQKPRYPLEWATVARQVKWDRAEGLCECEGECGSNHGAWGRDGARCAIPHLAHIVRDPRRPEIWWHEVDMPVHQLLDTERKVIRVVLTVAHLCACDPLCAERAHLKAMCNRCHLCLDRTLHQRHAAETRRLTKESLGQLALFGRRDAHA